MIEGEVVEIAKNVYWVGVRDWTRRIFDALIPLPKGTSYNAYLIMGENSKALIDTVNPGFEKQLEGKIRNFTKPDEIDYIVMNHAEPDHAGSIPYLMKMTSKAKLVTTRRGVKMAQVFYHVPTERIRIVDDNEIIDLDGKTLHFIEAPMLHWPETMFTYLEEDHILFPCDFFGSHLAMGVYSDEIEDIVIHAQRYWGEIMMPFRAIAKKALEKLENLEIRMIAPSHGPIHRNPKPILDAYRRWAYGETKMKTTIIYVSMWGSSEKMVNQMAETLASEGIEVVVYNLTSADLGDIAKDLVDSRAIVLGAPTVLGGAHPLAIYASYLVRALYPPIRFAVLLSSYGWGAAAVKQMQEILDPLKVEVVGTLEVNGPPTKENIKQIVEIGKLLAGRIKGVS
jgi:flavorubredoxin